MLWNGSKASLAGAVNNYRFIVSVKSRVSRRYPKFAIEQRCISTFGATSTPVMLRQPSPMVINSSGKINNHDITYLATRNFSKKLIPRKAALHLTHKAREAFRKLIAATNSQGIMLRYEISSQHALRMAFKFDLIKDLKELSADDEGVSLEVLSDGSPKPPSESWNDGLPKLYIHHGAFMKVLGGTLDIDLNAETGELKPKLFDREGHEMDPNA